MAASASVRWFGRRGGWTALAVVAALALMLGACGSDDGDSSDAAPSEGTAVATPQAGGRLTVGLLADPGVWLPTSGQWGPSAHTVAKTIYDQFAVYDDQGRPQPYALESWIAIDDYTTWDLKVRPGITFHDGTPFDAEALRLNLQTYKDSALTSIAMQPVTGIEVVDDSTVRVTTNISWAQFPTALATSQLSYVVAPAQIKAGDTEHPIGSGPFVFVSREPGASMKVTRNQNYWRDGLPYLDDIEFNFIQDDTTRHNAVLAGDLDLIATADFETVKTYAKDEGTQGIEAFFDDGTEGDEQVVILNLRDGALVDDDLRLALAKATDRNRIVSQQFEGVYEVANGPYRPGSRWHAPSPLPDYDPVGASELVAKWSERNGGAAPQVRLVAIASPRYLQMSQLLEELWTEAGFDVVIRSEDETRFASTMLTGQFDALLTEYYNAPDPDADYIFWAAENVGTQPGSLSLVFPRWSDPEADQALKNARTHQDEAYRQAEYAKVWQIWAEKLPYLWLYHTRWAIVHSDRVEGVGVASLPDGAPAQPIIWGQIYFTEVWLSD